MQFTDWSVPARTVYGAQVRFGHSFFVLAFYVEEATLRHVHIQGRNTT